MAYINERELSELLGIPVPTLRTQRIRGGGPPFYRFGRSVRYEDAEALAWARARRALNTTDADRVAARLQAEAGGAENPAPRFAAKGE